MLIKTEARSTLFFPFRGLDKGVNLGNTPSNLTVRSKGGKNELQKNQ